MAYFGHFYLDREKDILIELNKEGDWLFYTLRTPNHHSGNLITNLARLLKAPLSEDEAGLKIITGEVPAYVDDRNREQYILRLGGTKVANIYPDGSIERKASVPAIAKTLMSQTKDYRLDLFRTLVKTYIATDCKFRTDLHTHMNANLDPDILMALGIVHQIRYPLYYVKKLGLFLTPAQEKTLAAERQRAEADLDLAGLSGKYRERRIDDNSFINFADLILNNPEAALGNIAKIRASLVVLKGGQAVFSNLEKVYLYRYVFTKGQAASKRMSPCLIQKLAEGIPDGDIRRHLKQMLEDDNTPAYSGNSLFQDKLLWIARSYRDAGIQYAEISDTMLARWDTAAARLGAIHEVMPHIFKETGVMLRFLAGVRRTPLTIVRDNIQAADYLKENLRVLRAVAEDPYVAGCDILGEEINDIRELRPFIRALVDLAKTVPGFVIRIHAGECDSLKDNVEESLRCVREALGPGQPMPPLRIGHGLYTCNLKSPRGRQLLKDLKESGAVLEFQLSSNVRLNNLSRVDKHPLKDYLRGGVACVQGTDGGALYGTNSIDEELALERLLGLSRAELQTMCETERGIIAKSRAVYQEKKRRFWRLLQGRSVEAYFREQLAESREEAGLFQGTEEKLLEAEQALAGRIQALPAGKTPIIVAGGSFNNSQHRTIMKKDCIQILDQLMEKADPEKVFFVIGHSLRAYEKYLVQKSRGRFQLFAIVPRYLTRREAAALEKSGAGIRISIEPNGLGLYKSFAYEIFKHRPSLLLALDGNAAGANLMQEAKNGRYKCRIFVNPHSRTLWAKAQSLGGYARSMEALEL